MSGFPGIDLDEVNEYRVRILRLADDAHPAGVVLFEGMTRFTLRPMPRFRGIPGPRYEITPTALDPGRGWQHPTNYRSGAVMIDDGYFACLFLDRDDPLYPYGPDGPTQREALEMALDTFCVREGIDGITWQ